MPRLIRGGRRRATFAWLGLALLCAGLAGCDLASLAAPAGPTPTAGPATPTPLPADPQGLRWQFSGLTAQSLRAVAGTGQADAPVYAGGDNGLFVSTDKGATWGPVALPAGARVDDVEVSGADPKVIYAGAGADCRGAGAGGQFRTTDGGATWQPLAQAPASIQIDAHDANRITGMSCRGMISSPDGGQTWTPPADSGFGQGGFAGVRVRVPANPIGPIYALWQKPDGTGRIRTSYDHGANWGGDPTEYPGLNDLLVDDKRPADAWAVSSKGILLTNDNGDHWRTIVTGLDAAHYVKQGSQGPYQLAALTGQYTNSGDMDELYAGTYAVPNNPAAGAFSSGDLGKVWGRFGGNLGGRDIRSIHVAREKASDGGNDRVVLYAGTDQGVYKVALGTAR